MAEAGWFIILTCRFSPSVEGENLQVSTHGINLGVEKRTSLLPKYFDRAFFEEKKASLQGALSTGLPRSIGHTRPCTVMMQEVVNMIVTMGLRSKEAQAPAAQRMTRMSFVLPPSCWRGWSGPS